MANLDSLGEEFPHLNKRDLQWASITFEKPPETVSQRSQAWQTRVAYGDI